MSGWCDLLDIVCWKWKSPNYRSAFTGEHVNILARMCARHYHKPHRFSCITDDPAGIAPGIRIIPLWRENAALPNLSIRNGPSCYRRLRMFSTDAAELIGQRFVSLDLDVVLTGDVTPLWDRPEDIVLWGGTTPANHYNASMILMTAGARRRVWDEFDPAVSPARAKAAGHLGSDQAWISYRLGRGEKMWSQADGVYSFRCDLTPKGGALPDGARLVIMHGKRDPWSPQVQHLRWVREHYR